MYVLSNLFTDAALGFAALFCFNAVTSMVLILFANPDGFFFWKGSSTDNDENWLYCMFPGFCLGQGIMNLIRSNIEANMMRTYMCSLIAADDVESKEEICEEAGTINPLTWSICGKFYVILLVQGAVFFIVNYVIDLLRDSMIRLEFAKSRGGGFVGAEVVDEEEEQDWDVS